MKEAEAKEPEVKAEASAVHIRGGRRPEGRSLPGSREEGVRVGFCVLRIQTSLLLFFLERLDLEVFRGGGKPSEEK